MFISVKFMREIYDLSRINPWGLWKGWFKQLRSWSRIKQKLPVWPWLTGSSLCGEKLYYVTELLRLRMPKPTTFPTQCCVWVVAVTDQWKPGKAGSNGILETCYLKDLNRIDGELMEFEWTNFPGFTTLKILDEIQKMMNYSVYQSILKEGSFCMSMYSDIVWREGGNKENCIANSATIADHARRFSPGRWSFLWPGSEKK